MFMLLSTEGVLVTYYMIYSHTEVPAITRPPQALPANPVRKPKLTQGIIASYTFVDVKKNCTHNISGFNM